MWVCVGIVGVCVCVKDTQQERKSEKENVGGGGIKKTRTEKDISKRVKYCFFFQKNHEFLIQRGWVRGRGRGVKQTNNWKIAWIVETEFLLGLQ